MSGPDITIELWHAREDSTSRINMLRQGEGDFLSIFDPEKRTLVRIKLNDGGSAAQLSVEVISHTGDGPTPR
jgi:hypothetical protein